MMNSKNTVNEEEKKYKQLEEDIEDDDEDENSEDDEDENSEEDEDVKDEDLYAKSSLRRISQRDRIDLAAAKQVAQRRKNSCETVSKLFIAQYYQNIEHRSSPSSWAPRFDSIDEDAPLETRPAPASSRH